MNTTIIKNWNATVTKEDTVWHLGDFSNLRNISLEKVQDIIMELNFKELFLIMGNHDESTPKMYRCLGFTEVYMYPIIIKDFLILSHEPKFLEINSCYANLYGHTHNIDYKPRRGSQFYYNCCVDVNDFKPVLLNTIINQIQNKPLGRIAYSNTQQRPKLTQRSFKYKEK